MARADQYRVKAAEFHAKAAEETRPFMRRSLEADVVYGPIVPRIADDGRRLTVGRILRAGSSGAI
jgi:hypothetical protein